MDPIFRRADTYFQAYLQHRDNPDAPGRLPGGAAFLDGLAVLALPREDGDSRYPYGPGGSNFWASASGLMHQNEGLFSAFLRPGEGQEPKIAFFAAVESSDGRTVLPLLPCLDSGSPEGAERFAVLNPSSVWYLTQWQNLRFAVRVFVGEDRAVRFTSAVQNTGPTAVWVTLSSYFNPFLMHDLTETSEAKWFREVRYLGGGTGNGLGSFEVESRESLSRTRTAHHFGLFSRSATPGPGAVFLGHEETTSRLAYVGGHLRTLHRPGAPAQGTFGPSPRHVTTFTETGVAADLVRFSLGASAWARTDTVFAYSVHGQGWEGLRGAGGPLPDPGTVDEALRRLEAEDFRRASSLVLTVIGPAEGPIAPDQLNPFFEHLKRQVEFCSLIRGYVQLSPMSLIGVRDVAQALEALTVWRPGAVRTKLRELLDFVDPSGRCPRQYALPISEDEAPVMDLRPFIDQGAWVISTVVTYLKTTRDFAFLDEECGFHEIVDEGRRLVRKTGLRTSVLDHLLRILDYLVGHLDRETGTGCLRALYGDWNDALDGLGVSRDPGRSYGTGVSVMASLQLYQNLLEMADLLETAASGEFRSRTEGCRALAEELSRNLRTHAVVTEGGDRRIVHGWGDGRSYLVGSFRDPDGKARHGLTSNAFWVLSGLADLTPDLLPTLREALRELDSPYGLKTFEPAFAPDAPGVGRIPKLPPGTAENGAAYTHASLFGAWALFRMGDAEEGWNQLVKAVPFTHRRVSVTPFVMPNSYGLNPEKNIDGESMLDWQTGSSNVLLKILVREVFGLRPDYLGLWIQPAAHLPFGGFDLEVSVHGCPVRLRFRKSFGGRRSFLVNGRSQAGEPDPARGVDRLWIAGELYWGRSLDVEVVG